MKRAAAALLASVAARPAKKHALFGSKVDATGQKFFQAFHPDVENVLEDVIAQVLSGKARETLYTAGFPCQPYSSAGKHAGAEDSRAQVVWKILGAVGKEALNQA